EELGDLLLQVVLHTQIAIDDGEFYMADVLRHVSQKMIRRHPHVWGSTTVENADQVVTNWEALKRQEHAHAGKVRQSRLDGIPLALPALAQAYQMQRKAAKDGFDWEHAEDVLAKVHEELDEVQRAVTPEHRLEEIGDLLFVLVNWARWLGIDDPESALRAANQKFARRFQHVEMSVNATGQPMSSFTLAQLDAWWDEAKQRGL
ncbi:MAG: nucleoside triphosphate pyrophosphohydrolase, partial [Armatimonadetes bacterium]|nr:nucleoside triphosphate pyrophosphohydrolase [Anaerolineae bacterium]